MRVAIVGAGPAGLYAAEVLAHEYQTEVDIFEALPVPCGLVRYGVAPDHFSIRSVRDKLVETLDNPKVRFFGNVSIGSDITTDELSKWYDAVIYTYGAAKDRSLGIPGEDHPMSIAATDFVKWYTGHPDAQDFAQHLRNSREVIVIGLGNVAIDVARILIKPISELRTTDMPEHVLSALESSQVRHVRIVGRRGPQHATFTTKELKELGEIPDVDVLVNIDQLPPDDLAASNGDRVVERNLKVLREWANRHDHVSSKSIEFLFFSTPESFDAKNSLFHVHQMEMKSDGEIARKGVSYTIPADLVIRSVGYQGVEMSGLPFDNTGNVIPSENGRILNRERDYVAGWIKRGPSGIIGTNKKDATNTVNQLMQELNALSSQSLEPLRINEILEEREIEYVDVDGWKRIDAAERGLGLARGSERTTIHERSVLLNIARGV